MRKYILVSFLLIQLAGKAQNYQPLNSHSFQLFFQYTPYNNTTWGDDCNMWGTRIDSSALSLNGDSVFFNYTIVRDTAVERDEYNIHNDRCIWISAPNWNGYKTIISTIGNSLFFNENGDTILVKHNAPIDSSWYAYTYPDSSFLLATVQSIYWKDDIWTQDSVKTISLQHIDSSNNSIPDIINGLTIELYKDHGFRRTVDFVKFPFDTISLLQLDVNYINTNVPNSQIPQVGDITSESEYCNALNGQYPNWGTQKSKKILEVIFYNSDSVRIKYLYNTSYSETHPDYSTSPPHLETTNHFSSNENYHMIYLNSIIPPDSFISIFGDNVMPREHAAPSLFISTEGNPSCLNPKILTYRCSWLINEDDLTQTDSCTLGFVPFKCNQGGYDYFTPYIGYTSGESWSANDGNEQHCTQSTSYIKRGDLECGEYWFTGIDDKELSAEEFNIYPNPATNLITIETASCYNKLMIRILTITGQEVYQRSAISNKSVIDISTLSPGVYFVSLSNGNKTVTKKLIKE